MKFARRLGLAALLMSLIAISFGQSDNPPPNPGANHPPAQTGAKNDMKEAGQAGKQAAQKTGSAAKKTTKKGTHAAAKGTGAAADKTQQGAAKVENKTAAPQ